LFEIVFRPSDPPPAVANDFMTGAVQPLTGQAPVQLPTLRPWLLALGAVAIAYLLISLLLWWTQVSDTVAAAAHILTTLHVAR
jgi:hypothetical protein